MATEFYIDESGNTGDLSKVKIDSYFSEQRMFALAALGRDIDQNFNDAVLSLKKKHRIQAPEIKSTAVYNKPRFILDLLTLIEECQTPIFIELIDKHYFVVANIVEMMIVPHVGVYDLKPETMKMKSIMAEFLALYAPPQLAQSFAECCQSRDHGKIKELYGVIIQWAQECPVLPANVAHAFDLFTRDSLSDFSKMSEAEAVDYALPVPDSNPAGNLLWILPNLTSFTNIYARINHYARKQISDVTLFHDEQLQFGEILKYNKQVTENLMKSGMELPFKTSDFEFNQAANLKFLRSHDSIGIQVADVLAGFVTRYVQDFVWGKETMHSDKIAVFKRLIENGNKKQGTGINFVVPDSMTRFLGVEPIPNY